MQFGFNTENINRGKAVLLLYAMYRSRDKNSSLSGKETWDRVNSYIRGAILKSSTVSEFVGHFCKKANIQSVKPRHLKTDGLVQIDDLGTLASVDGIYNYQLGIFEEREVLNVFATDTIHIIMLVRERIQREKELFTSNVEEENENDIDY